MSIRPILYEIHNRLWRKTYNLTSGEQRMARWLAEDAILDGLQSRVYENVRIRILAQIPMTHKNWRVR